MHSYNTTQYSHIATTYNIANYIQHNINNNYTTQVNISGSSKMKIYTCTYRSLNFAMQTIFIKLYIVSHIRS